MGVEKNPALLAATLGADAGRPPCGDELAAEAPSLGRPHRPAEADSSVISNPISVVLEYECL